MVSRARLSITVLVLLCASILSVPQSEGAESSKPNTSTSPRFAKLQSYETKFFVLETDADALFATELSDQLDAFAARVQTHFNQLFQRELPIPRLTLTVFEDRKDYIRHTEIHAPQLTSNGGYYDGALKKVISHRYNTNIALFFHELTHGMMGELFDDHHFYRYTHEEWPVWFDEGLAEYLSYSGEMSPAPGTTHPGKFAVLYNAMVEGELPSLGSVLQSRAESFSGPEMNMSYAVAWGFVAFLAETRGKSGALAQYLRALLDGKGGEEAFKTAFQASPSDLEDEWWDWLVDQTAKGDIRQALISESSQREWTIHEGGDWRFDGKDIRALSSGEYDYLIRNVMPLGDFRFQVEVKLLSGKAGLILGNNKNGQYPYEYLVDFTRKSTGIRKSKSAQQLLSAGDKLPPLPTQVWHRIVIEVLDKQMSLSIDGSSKLSIPLDPGLFSLVGLYVHNGECIFRNPVLLRGPVPTPRKKK